MSSTACWPWPSPTCCAARPTTPACTCRSASCWPSWPASRKPCCSTTTAAKAAPGLGACSPTWTPPNSAWPTCSTFTATHRPADHAHTGELGNTPTPPAHTVLPAETPSTNNQGRKLPLGAAVVLAARGSAPAPPPPSVADHAQCGRPWRWLGCRGDGEASQGTPELDS